MAFSEQKINEIAAYHPALLRYLFTLTRDVNEAKDMAQQAILNALDASEKGLEEPRHVPGYMRMTALNAWRMELRRRKAETEKFAGKDGVRVAFDRTVLSLKQSVSISEVLTVAAIKDRLLTLTPLYQEAFELRYIEGHTLEEIAEMRSVSTGTLKRQMFKLREKLADFDPGLD